VILHLSKPLEKTIRSGHPWLFCDALEPFDAAAGTVVTVMDRCNRFLCRGLAEEGPIGVRVFLTTDSPLDDDLFNKRILKALRFRDSLRPRKTTALRLISGEGDGLPGLILDQYGPYAVLMFDGSALGPRRESLCAMLQLELKSRAIHTLLYRIKNRHEKSVVAVWGKLPDNEIIVLEHGMKLFVDLVNGQKTGLFLDHRDSRLRTRAFARNKRVLNLYGYTGGFSVAAGLGGAKEVTTVDIAPAAIRLADKSWLENGLDPSIHHGIVSDVPAYINVRSGARFDLVIADPPSFAPKKSGVPGALQSYRLLHASVFRSLRSRGIYIAASCSSHVTKAMFETTLTDAARSCHKSIIIDEIWGAGKDHPVLKDFPEGDYLKVFKVAVEA
jgi:23S rRNA (cytosine1962-C5)-methyltransferase